MINNLYSIGLSALQNAQVSVNNASNNIANADTEGYQRTVVSYETGNSVTISGETIGTGADIVSIQSQYDMFVESQYLDAYSDLSRQSSSLEYLSQLDSLLNQTDGGLNDQLSAFFDAWNELTTDPDSLSGREDLLGESETLIYAITSTMEELQGVEDTINSEIQSEVEAANELIEDLAALNAQITANPDDDSAISQRDATIRELDAIIGVDVIYQDSGAVTIMTDEGYTLLDGTQTHSLVYSGPQVSESLTRDSDYDGTLEYSGTSSEEILIEFVSSGTDGTAQFKVSTDGGNTWLEDDDGSTLLYTAGDEDSSVEIEGVEIWFEGGTEDHEVGDRYTVVAKSGLYYENSDGSLQNITPMTDDSGDDVSGRTSGGSLAGLFETRDDTLSSTMEELDDFAEALIWEVNFVHSQGVGLEHHTALTGSYAVDDSTVALSESGLSFADYIEAGEITLVTYDSDDNISTTATISVDPATDSLGDIATAINTAFGGELTATVNSDGELEIAAASDMGFEVASDTSGTLAALGLNTYFTGDDASTISMDSYVSTDTAHLNTGQLNDDGTVSTGSNEVADTITSLSSTTVSVGGTETTLSGALSAMVSSVGSATSSAELQQTYASTSVDYLYDQQASTSEVNVDEELLDLAKYQQAYQAAAEIITVTREMMDIVLDLV